MNVQYSTVIRTQLVCLIALSVTVLLFCSSPLGSTSESLFFTGGVCGISFLLALLNKTAIAKALVLAAGTETLIVVGLHLLLGETIILFLLLLFAIVGTRWLWLSRVSNPH